MADTGAGGLGTTAIERCIDNWETETQDGAEIPAAHAELAALRAAAQRATALAAENARLRAAIAHFVAPIDPDDRAEFGTFVTVVMEAIDRLRAPLRPGDVEAALASWPDDPALDAPRAGGAGVREGDDGGDGG
jgi:hypothetical protein